MSILFQIEGNILGIQKWVRGNSLGIQLLELCTFTAEGLKIIPYVVPVGE